MLWLLRFRYCMTSENFILGYFSQSFKLMKNKNMRLYIVQNNHTYVITKHDMIDN